MLDTLEDVKPRNRRALMIIVDYWEKNRMGMTNPELKDALNTVYAEGLVSTQQTHRIVVDLRNNQLLGDNPSVHRSIIPTEQAVRLTKRWKRKASV